MQDAVRILATARRGLAAEKANLETVQKDIDFAFGARLGTAERQLAEAKGAVSTAEKVVRAEALERYAQDGDKKPHPAIQIKVYTVLDYYPAEARSFAIEHMHSALKLDKRTFEKGAKALLGMSLGEITDRLGELVAIRDDPRATIARDLGGY